MAIQTTRKCGECKENIVLEEYNFVTAKKIYYHFACYVNKRVNAKRNPLTVPQALEIAEELKPESSAKAKILIDKNHLYKWLQRAYELVVIHGKFYQKMEEIYSGRYRGLSEGIPPEDILYIWKKKKAEFDETNAYQRNKGKIIDGASRLDYDLAGVLSKYDSYKKWKKEHKIDALAIQNLKNEKKIDYNKILPVKDDQEDDFIIEMEEEL